MRHPLLFSALHAVIKALVGSQNYQRIQMLVDHADATALSGAEKRVQVAQDARALGVAVSAALLNLAIEVAVNALRSRRP